MRLAPKNTKIRLFDPENFNCKPSDVFFRSHTLKVYDNLTHYDYFASASGSLVAHWCSVSLSSRAQRPSRARHPSITFPCVASTCSAPSLTRVWCPSRVQSALMLTALLLLSVPLAPNLHLVLPCHSQAKSPGICHVSLVLSLPLVISLLSCSSVLLVLSLPLVPSLLWCSVSISCSVSLSRPVSRYVFYCLYNAN